MVTGQLLAVTFDGNIRSIKPRRGGLDHTYWNSCQFSPDSVFQLSNYSTNCRVFTVDFGSHTYVSNSKTNGTIDRRYPCLASDSKKHIFVIGGKSLSSVSIYSLTTDSWSEELPDLTEERGYASACHLNGVIYVVAGRDDLGCKMNSIEKLCLRYGSAEPKWQRINIDRKVLSRRFYCAMSVLNSHEIVIYGGYDEFYKNARDIAIFDTRTDTCRQRSSDGKYGFQAFGNQAAIVQRGKVVTLAAGFDNNEPLTVISWT